MSTEENETHEETVTESATAAPAPMAMPTDFGFIAQCEKCDEAAVETDPPETSTHPFRKGFCAAHVGDKSPSAVKRPIEHWATAKGMLPRMLSQGKVEQTGRLVPARQNPKFADFHRARQGKPVGHEMTEAEFDAAVAEATTHAFH